MSLTRKAEKVLTDLLALSDDEFHKKMSQFEKSDLSGICDTIAEAHVMTPPDTKQKAREFWIDDSLKFINESGDAYFVETEDTIHVIEISALTELKAELWVANDRNLRTYDRHELEAKLAKAVEALRFECGNRCAEQNPCNAKETLKELEKK